MIGINYLLKYFFFGVLVGDVCGQRAVEMLVQNVQEGDAGRFLSIDTELWNPFLQQQDGFIRKVSTLPFYDTLDNATVVYQTLEWESFDQWHAINNSERIEIIVQSETQLGYSTNMTRFPDENGLRSIYSTTESIIAPSFTNPFSQAMEILRQDVQEGDLARFLKVDEQYWTSFLKKQDGFQSKDCLIPYYDTLENATTCYQIINWKSFDEWKSIPVKELELISLAFVREMGYRTFMGSIPNGNGLRMVQGTDYPTHRRPVLNGYDVVMYHLQWDTQHMQNKTDIMGSPRWQYVLRTSIGSYTFWFSSPDTLALFESDPWKYAPAYGGHCSHHIATDEVLSKEDLDAGLGYAVVCINTNNWAIVNGTLYLNSCGMYYDFIAQPVEDVIRGNKRWLEWYGTLQDGPFNDVCFQDGSTGELRPPNCCPDWD